jgi:hypothetical protein
MKGGDKMHPTADPIPPRNFVSVMTFLITCGAMIVSVLALRKRLYDRGVHVYAQVTHKWDPPSTKPWGLSEHTYWLFAKWIDPQTQRTYYFTKTSDHPLDYREGDFVPATINLDHPFFRRLNI